MGSDTNFLSRAEGNRSTSRAADVHSSKIVGVKGITETSQKAIRFDGSTCIDLLNITNDANDTKKCLEDPDVCRYGFSAALWVKFARKDNFVQQTFLSTGSLVRGFSFYQQQLYIHVHVRSLTQEWTAKLAFEIQESHLSRWTLFGFMWSRYGNIIKIMIDDKVTDIATTPRAATPTPSPEILYFGCIKDQNNNPQHYLSGHVLDPSLWLWYVCDKVLMMGQMVHDLAKLESARTTQTPPTTQPVQQTDYSQAVKSYPGAEDMSQFSRTNPLYEVADHYYSLIHNTVSHSTNVAKETMRNRERVKLSERNALTKVASCPSAPCPCDISACSDGLTVTLWFKVATDAITHNGSFLTIGGAMSLGIYEGKLYISANSKGYIINPADSLKANKITNLAVTYKDDSLDVYVNGQAVNVNVQGSEITLPRIYQANDHAAQFENSIYLGNLYGASVPGIVLADIVIWTRKLFAFETHRFFGFTAEQLTMIKNGTKYWSSDVWVNDAIEYLCDLLSSCNLNSVYQLRSRSKDGSKLYEYDRWRKSKTPVINQDPNDIFVLGNGIHTNPTRNSISLKSNCVVDTTQCKAPPHPGLTVSIWLKIRSVSSSKQRIFLNSGSSSEGEIDTKGISLYTNADKLLVIRVTHEKIFTIITDSNAYSIGEWINFGLVWSILPNVGSKLYLNGIDYNININNGMPSSTPNEADSTFHLVVGSLDDNNMFKGKQDDIKWEIANMTFGSVTYYNNALDIDEYQAKTGQLDANRYYLQNYRRWQGTGLIDLQYYDLKYAKSKNLPIGVSGQTSWNSAVRAVHLNNGRINLTYFDSICPAVISLCTNGISIGGWFRMKSQVSGGYFIYFQTGNEADQKDSIGLELVEGQKLRAWLNSNGKAWTANVNKPETAIDQWVFFAVTWKKESGLSIYANGKHLVTNTTSITYASSMTNNDVRQLHIGEIYNSSVTNKTPIPMEVFNVVIYNSCLESQQMHKFLGIKSSQLKLLMNADLYYTFSGLYHSIRTPKPRQVNMVKSKDKYDDTNAAVCTVLGRSSYTDLGNISQTCLAVTNNCSSFILTLNLMIKDDSYEAVILSTGGRVSGSKGLTILKEVGSYLNFTFRNETHTWVTRAAVEIKKWLQIQFIWFKDKGLQVKINSQNKASVIDSNNTAERNANSSGNLFIGRHSDGYEIQPAAAFCISDIMFRFFRADVDVEAEANKLVDLTCYQDTDFHFALQGNKLDHLGNNLASSLNDHKKAISKNQGACVSDPSKCETPIQMSIWIKLNSGTSGYLMTTGPPSNRGFAMFASLGTDNKYNINATVQDGTKMWITKAGGVVSKGVWTNVAITWTKSLGVFVFVSGQAVARGNSPQNKVIGPDTNGNLLVGRDAEDVDSTLNGDVSNLAIWYSTTADCAFPDKSKLSLEGGCKAVTNETTAGKCNLQANCVESFRELCLDGTRVNLITSSKLSLKISSSEECLKMLQRVINKVKITDDKTLMAKAKLVVNIAKNWDIATDMRDEIMAEMLKSLNEILSDGKANEWKALEKSGFSVFDVLDGITQLSDRICRKIRDPCQWKAYTGETAKIMVMQVPTSGKYKCPSNDISMTYNGNGNTNNRVILPFKMLQKHSTTKAFVSINTYKNLNAISPSKTTAETARDENTNATIDLMVNSDVISVSIRPTVNEDYANDEKISFSFLNKVDNVEIDYAQTYDGVRQLKLTQECAIAYYDVNAKAWNSRGCRVEKRNAKQTNGSCSHLTSFAALMQVIPPDHNRIHRIIISVLSYIGVSVSLICLLLFIILILVRKELSGERYLIHLNLCFSFFVAQFAFLLTAAVKNDINGCRAVGIIMHLFFVSGFAWLLVESLFAFYAVTAGIIDGRLKCYIPFAYGLPIVLVAATAGIDVSAYGHGDLCWLTAERSFIWAFLGPVLALSVISIVVCGIVACNLATPAIKKAMIVDQLKSHSKQTTVLIILMLLAWLMGTIQMVQPSIAVEYIFIIFNAPQGFWIFLCFGFLNPEVKAVLCRRKRNTVADSQQWENIRHPKPSAPTFHSASSHSPPPTYRSTRSLVSSSGSDEVMARPPPSSSSRGDLHTPNLYDDPIRPDSDYSGTLKYHA